MTSSDIAPNPALKLSPGTELDLDFTDILANGQAVGRADGMVVFCFGPLPGERARVRLATVKPRYAVGDLRALLSESPDRVKPFCPVFGDCGGCQLQHLAYAAQLKWKREVVYNALARIGGMAEPDVDAAIGMDEPRAYRNKMAVVVNDRRDGTTIGFYRQRSHTIVPIERCPILTPPLDEMLERITSGRLGNAISGLLRGARHLVARAARSTGRIVLSVTTDRPSESLPRVAPLAMHALPDLAGLENSFDLGSANAIVGRRHQLVVGKAEIEETVAGLRYRVSPGSFFQVNVWMLEKIFEDLQSRLGTPGRIVDLYCGAGTFALFFARHGWSVVGVEESAGAIAEAKDNAELNGLRDRVRFETGRVEQVLADDAPLHAVLREADAVFLDPPRKGCEEAVLAAIARAATRRVWYLSCDPATLARDLKFLVSKGYRLGRVRPFDMFPQTGHVETLVELEYSELVTRHD